VSSRVEEIADAVLYEGYILYPYRASATKNRKRFNFGVLGPGGGGGTHEGTSHHSMQTECLVLGWPHSPVEVKVRFLQIVARVAGELDAPLSALPVAGMADFRPVEAVEVGGKVYWTWQEAIEREVILGGLRMEQIAAGTCRRDFSCPPGRQFEPLNDEKGQVAAVLVRTQEQIEGHIEVSAQPANHTSLSSIEILSPSPALFRLRIRISNLTPPGMLGDSDGELLRSLVSAHTLLHIVDADGEFVSLLDPPGPFKEAAAACRNDGTFPVLAGEDGRRDTMLSSPIILYDYPRVAPESAGQFFDGTEIDEMLALRILTLTEDEKREMWELDEKGRQLLERTEALPPEHMMKLHGVLRGLRSNKEDRL
jgi:hypothetical protein